jgi:hypothetical protein
MAVSVPEAAPAPADTVATVPSPPTVTEAAPDSSQPSPVAAAADTAPKPMATPLAATPQGPVIADSSFGRTRRMKSDPQASKLYRSPRKAFFYSLMLPGAGQAYVGHWKRGAVYLAVDAGMAFGWWYYGVHKSDQKLDQAHNYADAHWSTSKYEKSHKDLYDNIRSDSTAGEKLKSVTPSRESYCGSIYGSGNASDSACLDLPDPEVNANYNNLHYDPSLLDAEWSAATRNQKRAGYANPELFYSLVGQENEFVQGWDDATSLIYSDVTEYEKRLNDGNVDTKPAPNPFGTSTAQGVYQSLRQESNDYAKMKTWFLGGIILNHLVSALDAALLAQSSNRRLYDMESRWWDGVQLWGGLAWNGSPTTQAMAWIRF